MKGPISPSQKPESEAHKTPSLNIVQLDEHSIHLVTAIVHPRVIADNLASAITTLELSASRSLTSGTDVPCQISQMVPRDRF